MKIGLKLGAEVQRLHRALTTAGHKIEPAEVEGANSIPPPGTRCANSDANVACMSTGETDDATWEALLEIEKNITINIYEAGGRL
jgi:hypothetical protein